MSWGVWGPVYALPSVDEERSIVSSWIDAAPGGFDAFYRRFQPPLRDFCRARLTDAADADDACQDALLRAYSASGRFRPTARVWPWLATIAANVCTDINRKKRDVSLEECAERQDDDADPDEHLARHLRGEIVSEALQDLPNRYRTPVYLRDVEGWSYADIATLERTTTAAVRSSLMRGRRVLRAKVQAIADGRGWWPLPAAVPGPWLRWRARRSANTPVWFRPELADALTSYLPALTNAAVAALAALSLTLPAAASQLRSDPVVPISSTGQAPTGAAGTSGGGSTSAGGSTGEPADFAVVAVEPVPGTAAVVSRDGGADATRETLEGKVFARIEPDASISQRVRASVDCDEGAAKRKSCDAADAVFGQLPDDDS